MWGLGGFGSIQSLWGSGFGLSQMLPAWLPHHWPKPAPQVSNYVAMLFVLRFGAFFASKLQTSPGPERTYLLGTGKPFRVQAGFRGGSGVPEIEPQGSSAGGRLLIQLCLCTKVVQSLGTKV